MISLWLLLFSISGYASDASELEKRELLIIQSAETQFDEGAFDKARTQAMQLWENAALSDSKEQYRIPALLARLAFISNDHVDLNRWFIRLYRQKVTFEFDIYKDPPALHEEWTKFVAGKKKEKSSEKFSSYLKRKSKFGMSFMPFGIGLFDAGRYGWGAAFAAADIMSVYLVLKGNQFDSRVRQRLSTDEEEDKAAAAALVTTGLVTFVGSYGYQMTMMLPEVREREPEYQGNTLRYFLSFFPLGVGQYKNGENRKAIVMGSIQLASLLVGFVNKSDNPVSKLGFIAFGLSYAYSMHDAWYYHQDYDSSTSFSLSPQVMVSDQRSVGAGIVATLDW